ncbi:HK97 family phage portal protein [Rhizobium sp. SG_E_25_P2]|uniref:phage portal protein n=1 Tax=Rhizobium sp. SG_E_25_P2 TaxID=2879942 RepID=UPI0024767650|nr:phage portal protein [Rhizobium sp. SG_E_25_P2]MDH6265635.1 HK97 family phage portal protein [Rhizobium sp. SG_E_25_P2]
MRNAFKNVLEIFKGERSIKKAVSAADPAVLSFFGLYPTASNIEVTPSIAMQVPAVFCAVGTISGKVGDLPAKLFDRKTREAIKDHDGYKLIHDEANAFTSASELRQQLTRDALLTGHGFAEVVRSFDGRPLELNRLNPHSVQCNEYDDGTPYYIVSSKNGGQVRFDFTDILHIAAPDGSPVVKAREAIALTIAFERHIASLFANGGRPSGVILSPKVIDQDGKKNLASSWFSSHSGNRAGGTAILDEGMDYRPLSTTLADAQFAENRLEQIREIARAFNIPPTMIFELSRGTWSNVAELNQQFLTMTLKPWLTRWAWAYARCLLTPEERARFYVEFVTEDIVSTDEVARSTAFSNYRSMGAMTANDVRAKLNMPPISGGDDNANPYTTSNSAGPVTAPQESAQ